MTIVNLTQHASTAEQQAQGVFDLTGEQLVTLKALLTFKQCPTSVEVILRGAQIARLAGEFEFAMIGGAPYLMASLEMALKCRGIQPLYSFTERCSVEQTLADGSIQKTAVFRHAGWVEA